MIPTSEQKTQCFILCCWFTKFYLPINVVRVGERTGNVFFLAGDIMSAKSPIIKEPHPQPLPACS
ncbi:DUF6888 family protein [Nostoc mirabile]|uniref:DUF6888 family protein n=1 Tax=Nostoc mirabile TaxID=2907820 RepID=UPI0035580D9C